MSRELVIDLFAGPGGWEESGVVETVGIEWDRSACETRARAVARVCGGGRVTEPKCSRCGGSGGWFRTPPICRACIEELASPSVRAMVDHLGDVHDETPGCVEYGCRPLENEVRA